MPRASSRSSPSASWSSSTASASSARRARVGVGRRAALGAPELERERDEPLLGAVVEVALDPAALLVARPRRSARATPATLVELCAELRLQARVLECESGRRAGRLDQLGLVAQARIVDDRRERVAIVGSAP